jgi:putative spermidine/putrescine transport system ATP-binding protein/spermidine/putrescine transport system ATP-binding protein
VYSGNAITYKASAAGGELTVFVQNRSARLFAPGTVITLVWSPEHTVAVA